MGTRSPRGRSNFLGENVAAHCKIMGHFTVIFNRGTILDEDSNKPKEPRIRWGADPPRGRDNFRGLSRPFKSIVSLRCSGRCSIADAFAAKGIIQSSITSRSRMDNVTCQTSANSILKISGRRRCGL